MNLNEYHYAVDPTFLKRLPCPIIVLGPHGTSLFANQAFIALFSEIAAEAIQNGKILSIIGRWQEEEVVSFPNSRVPQKKWRLKRINQEDDREVWSLEEANQSPFQDTQFLSMMAHELRTPLNAILGLTQLVNQENEQKGLVETLHTLQYSGEHLLGLINDVLDFSKIFEGKLQLDPRSFNPKMQCKEIKAMLQSRALNKEIFLKVLIGDEVPEQVKGDDHRLKQVLINLINNAIKFTEEGGITVKLERLPRGGNMLWLRYTIEDSGIGIAPDKIQQIFEPFSQADTSTGRKYGGTGLGLTISRFLIESMGGNIRVESKPGVGTRFFVSLPMERHQDEQQQFIPATLKAFRDAKVLLVEDEPINQAIAKRYLSKFGIVPELAENGKRVLQWVEAETFDLILMDLHLPDAHGEQLARSIRHMNAHYHKIPILALTSTRYDEWEDKTELAQMNGYLTKPINPALMKRTLEEFFEF
ncbi:hybrid sensor histidine kinase/response regulator [Persicobacter diffluens]|uniref:histidine kinase n=1 Tax=Persicobacter diffluens TaxID=981 RepID=A0AAN4W112_9BACT|nr:hypothetical protein PEDI_28940 [Persicobacter diffluens]